MKFICSQHELNAQLSLVNRVVPSRPSNPVLANILFEIDADQQQVKMTGFDLSIGVQTSLAAQIDAGGIITLPAKLLSDIVSRLPDGDITLDDDEGELLITITAASGRYQVRGLSPADYPDLPTVGVGDIASLPVDTLIEGLHGSLFASSSDETKQVLTGVHLTSEADGLEFAATDGHRLAVVKTVNEDAANQAAEFNVTVPGKALRELERLLQSNPSTEAIALRFDQGQLVVEWEGKRLTSTLLEGQYPNYRQLIPQQFVRQMTVERRLLVSALERISVLADQKNGIVKMMVSNSIREVVLTVDAPDVGSGKEAVPAQITGDDLEIAFNVRYLLEGLKALTTAEVQMQFNNPTSPAIVTPLGGLKMTYLVMPVQIRS
ncbi:MAG: DNA polymerase III subunit beta [Elainellaceae cyanobacterium]